MTYLIFQNNNLYKIAANENDKNSLNLSDTSTSVEITESEFLEIRTGRKDVSYDGTNITYIDRYADPEAEIDPIEAEMLQAYHSGVIKLIDQFLESNPNNPMFSAITNYKTYLEGFDHSTLTYPMTQSWEKYCQDNSITYFHPLQIP
tara:strand:- start:2601 stop:3041 length:441 start_codon:yes stop_codon:yes gene_type:complete